MSCAVSQEGADRDRDARDAQEKDRPPSKKELRRASARLGPGETAGERRGIVGFATASSSEGRSSAADTMREVVHSTVAGGLGERMAWVQTHGAKTQPDRFHHVIVADRKI